jgi:PadR family transcriptional regulator, regulatory protein PadR
MRAESLKGHLDALVLAVLRDEPAHGYAVIEQLKLRSGGAFDLPEGTVYPVLHRLEADGLLSSAWSTASGRKRRVYKLTRRGQTAFTRQRNEWKSFSNAVQAVLA